MKKKHSWRFAPNKKAAICRDCGCVNETIQKNGIFYAVYKVNGKVSQKAPPCTLAFPTGIDQIIIERNDVLFKHERTVEQDVEINSKEQLKEAAIMLLSLGSEYELAKDIDPEDPKWMESASTWHEVCPEGWDKDLWIKMINKPYKDRLRIAGQLIAAELDRIDYVEGLKHMPV